MSETKLGTYVEGYSIPSPSQVVIVSDGSNAEPETVREEKRQSAEIARSKDDVLNEAEDYFKTICPECSGDAAKKHVEVWKRAAYHRLNN